MGLEGHPGGTCGGHGWEQRPRQGERYSGTVVRTALRRSGAECLSAGQVKTQRAAK